MIGNAEFDQLDTLLEDIPLIADRGFSRRVQRRIIPPVISREVVFVASACLWLTLAASIWSPEFIVASAGALLDIMAGVGHWLGAAFSLSLGAVDAEVWNISGALVLLPALGLAIYQYLCTLEV